MPNTDRYSIVYQGIADPGGHLVDVTDGFNSHDYLDGWSEIDFATRAEARAWMTGHHKGPDSAGYTARFTVAGPRK